MRKICSYCGERLVPSEINHIGISHGICSRCAKRIEKRELYAVVARVLDEIKEPTLIIENMDIVTFANKAARKVFKGYLVGELPGDVIKCVCASLIGGCGKTVHCSQCAIRGAIGDVLDTGVTCNRKVVQDFVHGDDCVRRTICFSMEKVENAVLMIISEIENLNIGCKEANQHLCWQISDD